MDFTQYLNFAGTVTREQMDIIVKAQPRSTREMVKSSLMCNLQLSGPEVQSKSPMIDPMLEKDDEKALFYINYSSLVDKSLQNEKNVHSAMSQAARNQNLQVKYGTNATGIYTIFHKKHFIIGGARGQPNHSIVYKTEEEKNTETDAANQSKVDMNKLWLIVKKVQFANPSPQPAACSNSSNMDPGAASSADVGLSGAEGNPGNQNGPGAASNVAGVQQVNNGSSQVSNNAAGIMHSSARANQNGSL